MFKRKQVSEGSNKVKQIKTSVNTRSEPWKQVFNDASEAFKQNKFKDSVVLFTRALSLNPNHTTILDCRAASYEKLNEFELALRDAVTIIKLSPTDSRGYLRAGKILSLQNKHQKAIDIYTRALSKVNTQDKRYQQVINMKNVAEKKVNMPSRIDFMKILPYDVISTIFSMLSFDRRIQCTGVSKMWRNFALNWSGMWRDLDFGNRKISHTHIKRYLAHAQGKHIRRFGVMDADQNMMRKVLQLLIDENCQYIEILDLVRCEIPVTLFLRMLRLVGKHLKNLRIDEGVLDVSTVISEIVPTCPQLTQLSMIGLETGLMNENIIDTQTAQLSHLTHLRVSINGRENANWLLKQCKSLQELDFYSSDVHIVDIAEILLNDNIPNLEKIHFSHGTSYNIRTQWFSSLDKTLVIFNQNQKLDTLGVYGDLSFTGELLELFVYRNYQSLKHLILHNCRSLDTSLARVAIAPGLPCIETLSIPGYIALQEPNLHNIIASCPTIQELDMTWISAVTDSTMHDLSQVTKKLRKLNISNCNMVTGVGLQEIVNTHKSSLEKLVLNNCQKIGPDAINWAYGILGRRVVECKFG